MRLMTWIAKGFLAAITNMTLVLMGDLAGAAKKKFRLLHLLLPLRLHLVFAQTGLLFILSWEKNARL